MKVLNTMTALILTMAISGAVAAASAQYSGFLANFPDMQPDADRDGVMIWQNPNIKRGDYSKVMIDSI